MSLKITGKVNHHVNNGDVHFGFDKYKDKKKKDEEVISIDEWNTNLSFEIWKKFKNSEVTITVTKK